MDYDDFDELDYDDEDDYAPDYYDGNNYYFGSVDYDDVDYSDYEDETWYDIPPMWPRQVWLFVRYGIAARVRNWWYINMTRCEDCGKRHKDCDCIPF